MRIWKTSICCLKLMFLMAGVRLAVANDALADGKVAMKVVGTLSAKPIMPVIYSRDGKSLLYFTEPETHRFEYWQADADGANPRRIYQTPVDMDDILSPLTGPSFSDKGGRVAVATTQNDKSFRVDQDPLGVGVIGPDGQLTKIEAEMGEILGFGFTNGRLIFLDGAGIRDREGKGYQLNVWNEKQTQTLLQSEQGKAFELHVSPDHRHAAFFAMGAPERKLRLRVVDLKTKKASDSDWFRSDDLTFDGAPIFYWDAISEGVFYHECMAERGKTPFSLMRFDLETKMSNAANAPVNTAVVAVLDETYLAVWAQPDARGNILRLSDGKMFVLPGKKMIIGGHGRNIAYFDLDTSKVEIARIKLAE